MMKNLVKSIVIIMMVAFAAACSNGAQIALAKQKTQSDATAAGTSATSAETAAAQAKAAADKAEAGATEAADSARRADDAVARLEAAFSSSVTK
jgi:hypothetical protein